MDVARIQNPASNAVEWFDDYEQWLAAKCAFADKRKPVFEDE